MKGEAASASRMAAWGMGQELFCCGQIQYLQPPYSQCHLLAHNEQLGCQSPPKSLSGRDPQWLLLPSQRWLPWSSSHWLILASVNRKIYPVCESRFIQECASVSLQVSQLLFPVFMEIGSFQNLLLPLSKREIVWLRGQFLQMYLVHSLTRVCYLHCHTITGFLCTVLPMLLPVLAEMVQVKSLM